jgi:hypothetical protein
MSDVGKDLTEDDLLTMVAGADDVGLQNGEEPKTRSFQAIIRVLEIINPGGTTVLFGHMAPPIVARIQSAIKKLYRPEDVQAGAVHLGMYMFRDFYCRVHVPIAFGSPSIEPINHIDLSEMQKRWMYSIPTEWERYHDQFFDLWDFGYGTMELGHSRTVPAGTISYMGMCRFHLQAASSVLATAYDYRGATQSALISVELALKAGLRDHGLSERDLRKFGHDLAKLADAYGAKAASFDLSRVNRVVATFPSYVPNRYADAQPTRLEAGEIVMGAQYIGSEVSRQLTDRNIRKDNPHIATRSYPA